jgi:hypothetical protein
VTVTNLPSGANGVTIVGLGQTKQALYIRSLLVLTYQQVLLLQAHQLA